MAKIETVELVAAVFSTKAGAVKARTALEKLDRESEAVQLSRIAVIEKGKGGKLTFSEADRKKGGIWSLAHNAAFVVGSALGKGATLLPDKWADDTAGLAEKLRDSGFPDDALEEIGEGLKEGAAVLITLVDSDDEKNVVARSLVEHGGKLIQKTLSKEVVGRLSEGTLAGKTADSVAGLTSGAAAAVAGATAAATGAAKGAAKDATTAATSAAKGATKKVKAVDAGEMVDTAKGAATVASGVAKDAISDPTGTAKDLVELARSQAKKLAGEGKGEEVKKTVKAATAKLSIDSDAFEDLKKKVEAAAEKLEADLTKVGKKAKSEAKTVETEIETAVESAPAAESAPTVAAPAKKKSATAKKTAASEAVAAAETPTAEPPAVASPAGPDDLRRLPDVGPVYERLLHDNGITTYAQVARLSADKLRGIFTGVDPESGMPVIEISAEQAKAMKAAAKELAAARA